MIRIIASARKRASVAQVYAGLSETEVAVLASVIPRLTTQHRVSAPVIRLLPPAKPPAPPLVEIRLGKRLIPFTPTDFITPGVPERYEAARDKAAGATDLALFALCALEEGGAQAIQTQIKDFDKVKDATNVVRLVAAQTFLGDYVVIARVLSHRSDRVADDMPVVVYRAEVIKNADTHLVIELAVPDEGQTPFPDDTMVHGTARLYGYLP